MYIDWIGEAVDHSSSPFLMNAVDMRQDNRRIVVDILHTNVDGHCTRQASSVRRSKLANRKQLSWSLQF